jgi:hypothetical protein
VVESDGLLNRCRLNPYLGFESRSLRLKIALAGRLFLCLIVLGIVHLSHAHAEDPAAQYLTIRRNSNWRSDVTPAMVAQDPSAYAGVTLEIEGRLKGILESEDASPIIALETKDSGVAHLRMSRRPDWLNTGARVRVLVIVTKAENENDHIVSGLPDEMEILAVASASELTAREIKLQPKIPVTKPATISSAPSTNNIPVPPRMKHIGKASGGDSSNSKSSQRYAKTTGTGKTLNQIVAEGLSPEGARVFPYYRSFIAKHNKRLTEQKAGDIAYAVLKFSEKMDMDPRLMVALIIAESDFRPEITSSAGAMGIAQLMPDEVQRLGLTNPYDPIQNIAGSVFLLKERLNKYSGSGDFKDANMQHIILALASYNAGMGAVKKYKGVPPYRETQDYVRKIEQIYRQLTAGDN